MGISNSASKKGIVVQLGEKRILTDENGSFYFNKLIPDKYYLEIDKSTIPFGVITNVKLPLELNLKADSVTNIQIQLIKTGGIEGKVFFEDSEKKFTNYSENPVVLVKLFNENESHVTQLNENNRFSFKEIKPGTWQILATLPSNQDGFAVINAQQTIEIVVDKIKKTEFAVRPVERQIEFLPRTFKLVDKQGGEEKRQPSIRTSTENRKKVSQPVSNNKQNQTRNLKLFDSTPINFISKREPTFSKLEEEPKFRLQNRITQRYKAKATNLEDNRTSSIKQSDNLTKSVASNLE